MQHVPALAVVSITIQPLVTGHAPYVCSDAIFIEKRLGLEHFEHDGSAAEELRPQLRVRPLGSFEAIHPFQDALAYAVTIRHGRHRKRLVSDCQIVEDGLVVHVHAPDAFLDDDCNLKRERWIIGEKIWHRECQHVTVAVLVLQSFTSESRASSRAAKEETASAHVGCGTYQVANALKAEHRVINKKRDRIDPVVRVRGTCGDKRADRASFGDSFFQNLAVLRLFVVQQGVHVYRFVKLADAGVDSHLPEERLHAEGAGFVWNDGNDQLANFWIA